MTKVLLYSGGMDSWLIDRLWKPDVRLYIDIEGSYSEQEKLKLPNDIKIIKFPLGIFEQESKFVPLRNLYFLMLASNYGDEICLGATAGDWGSKDKTPEFLDRAEEMINFLLSKQSKVEQAKHIHIVKNYVYKYKDELVKEFIDVGGDIKELHSESFSCFNSKNGIPCFKCKPCFRKYVCLSKYGYPYSKYERLKMYNYVKSNIVPRSKNVNSTYFSDRGSEGLIGLEVVKKLYDEFGGELKNDEQN